MRVERFDCTDGTHHFSVMQASGEFATCLMHDTREEAEAEMRALGVEPTASDSRVLEELRHVARVTGKPLGQVLSEVRALDRALGVDSVDGSRAG